MSNNSNSSYRPESPVGYGIAILRIYMEYCCRLSFMYITSLHQWEWMDSLVILAFRVRNVVHMPSAPFKELNFMQIGQKLKHIRNNLLLNFHNTVRQSLTMSSRLVSVNLPVASGGKVACLWSRNEM